MIFPAAGRSVEEPRPTALYAASASSSLANRWTSVNGLTMASVFTRTDEEYAALTTDVGLVDLGVLCRYTVRGQRAAELLGRLTSAPVDDLNVGESARGLILTMEGGVIDICDVLRLTEDLFFLTTTRPINRRLQLAARDIAADVDERTGAVAALGLLGPKASAAAKAGGFEISGDLLASQGRVRGVETALRPISLGAATGVEILYPAEEALVLWERLRRAAAPTPVGLDALEILRIEGGGPRVDVDFTSAAATDAAGQRLPVEIGLPHLAPTNRAWFNGRRSLHGRVGERRLVTLIVDADDARVGAAVVGARGEPVGAVTSSVFSPARRAAVCFADIRREAIMFDLAVVNEAGAPVLARFLETPESGLAAAFRAREKLATESRGGGV